jgi:drug/metabolite transporter (DMT)-like permease
MSEGAQRVNASKITSQETFGFILGFIAVVIFGGTLPMTRIVVGELDPMFLAAGRGAGGGVLALSVLIFMRQKFPHPTLMGRMLVNMFCIVIGFPICTAIGSVSVPSAHAGVVFGLTPLCTLIFASLWSGERPSLPFWLCSGAGALIVMVYALRQDSGSVVIGDLWLLGSVISAGFGYTLSAELSRKMPGWVVISWALTLSLPLTVPATIWYWPANAAQAHGGTWAAFAYLTAFSQYVGFFAWNAGLAMGGTSRVSQIQLLQSFVTLTLAALLAGETVGWDTIIAASCVVGLVILGRRLRVGHKSVVT